jgi:hypothetical protein
VPVGVLEMTEVCRRCVLDGYEVVEEYQKGPEVIEVYSRWLRYPLGKSDVHWIYLTWLKRALGDYEVCSRWLRGG